MAGGLVAAQYVGLQCGFITGKFANILPSH